jgi:hypothetical protein
MWSISIIMPSRIATRSATSPATVMPRTFRLPTGKPGLVNACGG